MADIYLAENVGISTGVWYTGKKAHVDVVFTPEGGAPADYSDIFHYNLQYIELPLLFKAFTNNISEKMRIYFQTGVVTGFCVGERYAEEEIPDNLPEDNFGDIIDFTWLIGSGVEMNVGTSNKAYFGVDYGHGLYNIMNNDYLNSALQGQVSIKNSEFIFILFMGIIRILI